MTTVQTNTSLAIALARQRIKNPRRVGTGGKQQKIQRRQTTDRKRVAPIPKQRKGPRTKCSVRRAEGIGGRNRTSGKNRLKRSGTQGSPSAVGAAAATLIKRLNKKEREECFKHLAK